MATPIVSFGAQTGGFVNTVTIASQDVGTGANRAAYVAIGASNVNDTPTGVSVGTDVLTAQGSLFTDASGWKFRLYAGALTVTGSQTITATWSNSFNVKLVIGLVLPSVNTGTLISDLTTGNLATTTSQPTWTIDSASGDTVVGLLFLDNAATFSATSPATVLTGTGLGGSIVTHGMYEAGATSVTIDGTVAGATNIWRGFGFNVPAGGGGTLAGTITLDDMVLSGTFATGALSQLAGGITLDDFLLSGFMGLAPGRVDTNPFKNWTGTLLPGVTIPKLVFLKLSDMSTVLTLTNQVTAGDGVLTVQNAALVPGTTYVVVAANADGSALGAEIYTAT